MRAGILDGEEDDETASFEYSNLSYPLIKVPVIVDDPVHSEKLVSMIVLIGFVVDWKPNSSALAS